MRPAPDLMPLTGGLADARRCRRNKTFASRKHPIRRIVAMLGAPRHCVRDHGGRNPNGRGTAAEQGYLPKQRLNLSDKRNS
jgi:hypothetical protein